ncbi:uncharacterized protein [Medicago truncatula]|uniref:uncharacterized protein isoform X3 n=1 Tax=Medicago truncatula TaxID=3880 RepID=UPI0019684E8E|nr:uncharacterized protein LOC11407475 isoform X3 [Medicago truncatula]
MEAKNQKSIERVVSQRTLQMSSSFSCQICAVGFLCGVCLTSFFLAALTSFGAFNFGPILFSSMSTTNSTSHHNFNMVTATNCNFMLKETERLLDLTSTRKRDNDERVSLLYSAWNAVLNKSTTRDLEHKLGIKWSSLPNAPHLENCKLKTQLYRDFDDRIGNERLPPWTSWKGFLQTFPVVPDEHIQNPKSDEAVSEGAYPPWIVGSDEDNYPLTRKVQRDIWIHQHPLNCSNPNVKFLVADWEGLPGLGIGAQIASMCGLLGIAINEGRVLVANHYNRADHDGCKVRHSSYAGSSRSSWNCYFFPETSFECRQRAFELMKSEEAWSKGVVTTKENYTSKHIWNGPTPRKWGLPWNYLQPTTSINGSLLVSHRKMDRRWWRAQAVRYFMRFPTEYTCNLMNEARHAAFGKLAAKMVLQSLAADWPKESSDKPRSDMDEYVWSNHKPWVPRPLLSMHVRIGDKACEMKVAEFEEYMELADQIRSHFPNLNSIWLSTEMQILTQILLLIWFSKSLTKPENIHIGTFTIQRWNEKYWGKGDGWILECQQG